MKKLTVLIVGCGQMGASHAKAYKQLPHCRLVGLVAPSSTRRHPLAKLLGGISEFDDFFSAVTQTQPDIVCIASYPNTHASYAIFAMKNGAHVFVEKPLGVTAEEALAVFDAAKKYDKKCVVGYILRHHPTWVKFIEYATQLGKPLVMRMNLNQQSTAEQWRTHKEMMKTASPLVDCGVHYVDVMCQMTRANPISVYAIGANLTHEISEKMYNYGCLQVRFDDGSVGWYEAGWGPMMSETAHFVKDVIGPNGSVSIVPSLASINDSADVNAHTLAETLLLHSAKINEDGSLMHADERVIVKESLSHDELCLKEQLFLLDAIQKNKDLSAHLIDAINSLRIVLAADQSVKTGEIVRCDSSFPC